MKKIKTKFKDLFIYNSKNHVDRRGYFRELVLEKIIKSKLKFYVVSKSKKKCLEVFIFKTKTLKENFFPF